MDKKIASDKKNFFYNLTLNFLPVRLTAVVSGILSFMVGGKLKKTPFLLLSYIYYFHISGIILVIGYGVPPWF